jgi:hypothetical protein
MYILVLAYWEFNSSSIIVVNNFYTTSTHREKRSTKTLQGHFKNAPAKLELSKVVSLKPVDFIPIYRSVRTVQPATVISYSTGRVAPIRTLL